MKSIILLAGLLMAPALFSKPTEMTLDTKASSLKWLGKKVVGDTHDGTIMFESGSLTWDKNGPKSGMFTVDMKSIVNNDLKDAKWNQKLVGHLKSDDFFAVKNFPTSTLKATKFTSVKKDTYRVDGELTIRGITKPISFTATVKKQDKTSLNAVTEFTFDRTVYDVKYNSKKFFSAAKLGDKLISDDIKLTGNLVFKTGQAKVAH